MSAKLPGRRIVAPLLLFACLLLGGASAAGFAANLALQLTALLLLGWSFATPAHDRPGSSVRALVAIVAAFLVAMLLQLVPLPPAVWTLLPGRDAIAQGYALLGLPLPWLPLSLAPENALASLLWLLPAFAMLAIMLRRGAFKSSWIGSAVLAAAALGVPLGALQIVGGEGSPWYFYRITNYGQATGFFANSNHAATLLVCAIPFLAALQLTLNRGQSSARRKSALVVITAATLLAIAVGLVINFSLAGLGLAVPVSIASFLMLGTDRRVRLWIGGGATALFTLAAVGAILVGPVRNNLTDKLTGPAVGIDQLSRQVSISKTLQAAADFAPFGSGVGTFQAIYRTREVPADVITTYMNHAHSDLAEILLETGAIGALLVLLLLVWCVRRACALWRAETPDYFARAATIAAFAMMAHSLVDYPLRTAGLSTLFAACLALMADARPFAARRRERSGSRHLAV